LRAQFAAIAVLIALCGAGLGLRTVAGRPATVRLRAPFRPGQAFEALRPSLNGLPPETVLGFASDEPRGLARDWRVLEARYALAPFVVVDEETRPFVVTAALDPSSAAALCARRGLSLRARGGADTALLARSGP
jgi:hypothetical protein